MSKYFFFWTIRNANISETTYFHYILAILILFTIRNSHSLRLYVCVGVCVLEQKENILEQNYWLLRMQRTKIYVFSVEKRTDWIWYSYCWCLDAVKCKTEQSQKHVFIVTQPNVNEKHVFQHRTAIIFWISFEIDVDHITYFMYAMHVYVEQQWSTLYMFEMCKILKWYKMYFHLYSFK